jgi:hypothetical protein
MDNPQHYQPLSHALHPPVPASPQFSSFPSGSKDAGKTPEDDEGEDDDEGMVEEQLDLPHPASNPTSPADGGHGDHQNTGFVI